MRAAFSALNAWVADGTQPPHSPAIKVVGGCTIARDAHGDAIGGIRTPAVDVPTESLSGEYDPNKSVICSLFGSRAPFTAATLKQLYPTHADYVDKVRASAAAAVRAGFLLAPDARDDRPAGASRIDSRLNMTEADRARTNGSTAGWRPRSPKRAPRPITATFPSARSS